MKILPLDPQTYRRHPIHTGERIWAETNCYVDVWTELLHATGHEPIAALPFTFTIDFEGDQWTFFKFPLADIRELFGIEVQELAIWRAPVAHIEEQVGRGRPVLIELDSYYLPDTAGTAYQTTHVKSTVAVVEIDIGRQTLGYFHGQGYYRLHGEDFANVLRLHASPKGPTLPPYAEFAKLHRNGHESEELVQVSLDILRRHLSSIPLENPFSNFKIRFERDLSELFENGLEAFHEYSFATLRQFGACYELSATYLQWLSSHGEEELEEITRNFLDLAGGAKTLQFQLARSLARRKSLDLSALDVMANCWASGTTRLKARY